IVNHPAFAPTDHTPFTIHTRWIETEFHNTITPYDIAPEGAPEAAERERVTVEVGGKRIEVVLPAGLGAGASAPRAPGRRPARRGGAKAAAVGGDTLVSPMQGTIVKVVAEDGQEVRAGDTIVVLEAMKMEQPLTAHKAGTVTGLSAQPGQSVGNGAAICDIKD
ncbi:acetyl-CoA carboxylase biotin carboxyl carrier protein subunit, partial [Allonocardiopsis opalescens]